MYLVQICPHSITSDTREPYIGIIACAVVGNCGYYSIILEFEFLSELFFFLHISNRPIFFIYSFYHYWVI